MSTTTSASLTAQYEQCLDGTAPLHLSLKITMVSYVYILTNNVCRALCVYAYTC